MLPSDKISPQTRLGFIGLGHLGSQIARRLAAAGFPLMVYDRDPAKADPFATLGVEVANHPTKLAASVDVILSCLPDDFAVESAYLGPGMVLDSANSFAMVIEMSTVAPETSRRVHRAARKLGVSALDVPVSGSTLAAEAGRLTLFGGGERADFDAAQPIFRAIAAQWFHMGPAGSGAAMKLVVNTLLGLGMEAIAEAVALGAGLGLPRDVLFDALAKTAVVAPAHAGKIASAKRNDYTPQFPLRLMQKDFALILNEAARSGVSMPAAEVAAITFDEIPSDREEDFSVIVRRLERLTKADHLVPPAA